MSLMPITYCTDKIRPRKGQQIWPPKKGWQEVPWNANGVSRGHHVDADRCDAAMRRGGEPHELVQCRRLFLDLEFPSPLVAPCAAPS